MKIRTNTQIAGILFTSFDIDGKGEIWFTFYDFDIREYADLEEMKLTLNVEDVATNEYIFTVDVGSIYFNAEMPADAEQTTSAEPVTEVTHSYEFPLPLDVKFGNSPEKVQLQEDKRFVIINIDK